MGGESYGEEEIIDIKIENGNAEDYVDFILSKLKELGINKINGVNIL